MHYKVFRLRKTLLYSCTGIGKSKSVPVGKLIYYASWSNTPQEQFITSAHTNYNQGWHSFNNFKDARKYVIWCKSQVNAVFVIYKVTCKQTTGQGCEMDKDIGDLVRGSLR